MTVHIGLVTSEVRSSAPITTPAGDAAGRTPWETEQQIVAAADRVNRIRLRTSTGYGDD